MSDKADFAGYFPTERALARLVESLLREVAPEAHCQAQEWDRRLDCNVTVPGHGLVCFWLRYEDLTTEGIAEFAVRLGLLMAGETVDMADVLPKPISIARPPDRTG